ncbi:MAG: hypothetical protein WAO74_06180 [Polaribacter sp.]|uniref:hypothetical protein n=1 Tax=Polaribacter sp. TaxID=1920175 RepID=UPI003BAF5CD0
MKKLSILLFSAILFSCSSSDSETPLIEAPNITFDVNAAILLAPGSDITSLVTFNGQPAATYTSTLELNSILSVGRPGGLLASDEFIYDNVVFKDNNGEEVIIDENTLISSDGNLKITVPAGKPADYYDGNYDIDVFNVQAIKTSSTGDIDYKYDLYVIIKRNGTEYGPFLIDPKIKIRS